MIEVRDLVKRYGNHLAVDHLSFTVEAGQIYGFLGPNGAGKSTTMNIMTGYLTATEGTVAVGGYNLEDAPLEVRRRIGYLPEHPPLYIDMTVEEYLKFAAKLKGVAKGDLLPHLQMVLDMAHLTDVRTQLIRNLSKGYRQRVGIGQALVGLPEVLILDEPTVGLDPKQIIEIRTLIRSLAGKHTIIISSHILSEIQELCDHILIIHHGKIVASGTPAELEYQLAGPATLELTVEGSENILRESLTNLPGITSLQPCSTGDPNTAKVRIRHSTDVRKAVYYACVKADLPILEMRYRSSLSLEDIFLKLTNDELIDMAGGFKPSGGR